MFLEWKAMRNRDRRYSFSCGDDREAVRAFDYYEGGVTQRRSAAFVYK